VRSRSGTLVLSFSWDLQGITSISVIGCSYKLKLILSSPIGSVLRQ
jgi:hypothetical protein